MAEEKNKPKPKPVVEAKSSETDGKQTALDAHGFQKTVNDALQDYLRTLRELQTKGGKRSEELYQEYLKSQREQQVVADESLKEDYRSYINSMQQVWGQENAQTKADDANRDFVTIINDRQIEVRKNLEELYRKYIESVQQNIAQTQQDYSAAYQDFLRSFQTAWSKADLTNFDAITLASAGQILIAASNCSAPSASVK